MTTTMDTASKMRLGGGKSYSLGTVAAGYDPELGMMSSIKELEEEQKAYGESSMMEEQQPNTKYDDNEKLEDLSYVERNSITSSLHLKMSASQKIIEGRNSTISNRSLSMLSPASSHTYQQTSIHNNPNRSFNKSKNNKGIHDMSRNLYNSVTIVNSNH